jgi:ketosteroid isomerase-like protein
MMRRCLLVVVASLVAATSTLAQASGDDATIVTWLRSFDRAFMAKDLAALSSFYHPDVTIFEGGGVNNGCADYRDRHIGPELKSFENLQFEHRNVAVHLLDGGRAAYVTSEYPLKARANGRDVDTGGLETLVLVKDAQPGRFATRTLRRAVGRQHPEGRF